MRIILASNNKDKLREIKKIYDKYEVYALYEIENMIGKKIPLLEQATTFNDNAISKAKSVYDYVKSIDENCICLADDSGLVIDSLDGFPGILTHRWMDASDRVKNNTLIKRLEDKDDRACHYVTSIAVVSNNLTESVTCMLDGEISRTPRGTNGFGFDEIFEINGKTLAELT